MKNSYRKIVLLFLGFMMLGPTIDTCKAESASTRIILVIDIVWGRVSRDCKGFGICDFDVSWRVELDRPIKVSLENNIFEFEIPLEVVKKNPDQFGNDIFIMEEDFEIDKEISKEFGSLKSLVIPAGKYRMKRGDDALFIKIPQK